MKKQNDQFFIKMEEREIAAKNFIALPSQFKAVYEKSLWKFGRSTRLLRKVWSFRNKTAANMQMNGDIPLA